MAKAKAKDTNEVEAKREHIRKVLDGNPAANSADVMNAKGWQKGWSTKFGVLLGTVKKELGIATGGSNTSGTTRRASGSKLSEAVHFVGSNFAGDIDAAIELLSKMKTIGVDAAEIQAITKKASLQKQLDEIKETESKLADKLAD